MVGVTDAVYDYIDFLLDKKSFYLRGPADMDTIPKQSDYNMDDPRERLMFGNEKIKYRERIEDYKQEQALQIMAFVITRLMELTPEEALNQFEIPGEAEKYIEIWKLDKVMEYIRFPPGLRRNNYRYLFSLVFPDIIHFDEKEQTLYVYRQVLNGSLSRFPRNFFRRKARNKLCTMLLEYISLNIRVQSSEQIYDMFRDPVEGNKILKSAKLFSAYREFFSSPLEFAHLMMLQIDEEEPVLYNIYSYMLSYNAMEREVRSKKGRKLLTTY